MLVGNGPGQRFGRGGSATVQMWSQCGQKNVCSSARWSVHKTFVEWQRGHCGRSEVSPPVMAQSGLAKVGQLTRRMFAVKL
jgi:hypothetical protein